MTEKMLNLMRSFKVDPSRFELIRDQVRSRLVTGISRWTIQLTILTVCHQLRRSWQNMKMEEPYQLVSYYAHYAESEYMWTMQEKGEELECNYRRDQYFRQNSR